MSELLTRCVSPAGRLVAHRRKPGRPAVDERRRRRSERRSSVERRLPVDVRASKLFSTSTFRDACARGTPRADSRLARSQFNCFVSAGYVLAMRKRIKITNFKDWDSMFYNNLLSIPVLVVFSFLFETWSSDNLVRNLCVPFPL